MKVLQMIAHFQGPLVSWDSLGASDIWLSHHRATTCAQSQRWASTLSFSHQHRMNLFSFRFPLKLLQGFI